MQETVLVIGMQEGYIDEEHETVAKLERFLERTEKTVLFAKFVNQPGSNFVTTLDWHEMFKPEETRILERFDRYADDDTTFTHSTYSALTSQQLQDALPDDCRLYLCGVDTDASILDTALHAFNTGMDVHVIEDLCASTAGADHHQAAILILERTIGQVVEADDLT